MIKEDFPAEWFPGGRLEIDSKESLITYQHDGNFLPGSQQLEAETVRNGDQPVFIVSVETVTLLAISVNILHQSKLYNLQNSLVDGSSSGLDVCSRSSIFPHSTRHGDVDSGAGVCEIFKSRTATDYRLLAAPVRQQHSFH